MSSSNNAASDAGGAETELHVKLRWKIDRDDESLVTVSIETNGVVVETFLLPRDWRADNALFPLPFGISWLDAFFDLGEQERREKYGGKFEKYMLARREAECANPPRNEEDGGL